MGVLDKAIGYGITLAIAGLGRLIGDGMYEVTKAVYVEEFDILRGVAKTKIRQMFDKDKTKVEEEEQNALNT